MSWKWEYAFGAEEVARTAPADFLAKVEAKADELVRAAEAFHVHGRSHDGGDPKGGDIIVPGGMFTCSRIRSSCGASASTSFRSRIWVSEPSAHQPPGDCAATADRSGGSWTGEVAGWPEEWDPETYGPESSTFVQGLPPA